jgi:hypothetical protein
LQEDKNKEHARKVLDKIREVKSSEEYLELFKF